MEYFKSLTQNDLASLIRSTERKLFVSLPLFYGEIADAIMSIHRDSEKKIGIHILVDFDAQTFRQGYGEIESFEQLIKEGIEIKTLNDNRISFIIVDDKGYYLFIESRSLIPADKETINAMRVDPVSIVRLKQFFFGKSIKMNYQDELKNAIIDEGLLLDKAEEMKNLLAPVATISQEELQTVSNDLKSNPPLNPDYKRIVEFYSNKFQYVKLKFNGSNLQHRKIELPPRVLPVADTELKKRLETKLNLFDQDLVDETFSSIQELKEQLDEIREKYLPKVKSREERLLDKNRKSAFEQAVVDQKAKIGDVKTKCLVNIGKQIKMTSERLIVNLADFLAENPKVLFPEYEHLWENNEEYIEYASKEEAMSIVTKIKWPKAHDLLDELSIDLQYSDITYEDLKNKTFIKELLECGLIDDADEKQLASFGKGIETKEAR
jgi:hypothetical protein